MRREQVIAILKQHQDDLRRLGVTEVYLFGSVARDQATAASDVDVLVELDHGPTLFELARIKIALEKWLSASVDLGLKDSVRPAMHDRIYGEAIRAA